MGEVFRLLEEVAAGGRLHGNGMSGENLIIKMPNVEIKPACISDKRMVSNPATERVPSFIEGVAATQIIPPLSPYEAS